MAESITEWLRHYDPDFLDREAECRRLAGEFGNFVASRAQRLKELIEERTADPDMQEKVFEALVSRVLRGT